MFNFSCFACNKLKKYIAFMLLNRVLTIGGYLLIF